MSDNDLIRRGQALERLELAEHDAEERDWRSGANEIARLRKYVAAIPAVQPTVKPLVWKGDSIRVTAKGMGKYYACMRMFHGQKGAGWEDDEGDWHPTIEAAKAAAQADYEARILSALDMQPTVPPEQPVATTDVAALVEALREISIRPCNMIWGEDAEVRDAMRDMQMVADAALARVKGVM